MKIKIATMLVHSDLYGDLRICLEYVDETEQYKIFIDGGLMPNGDEEETFDQMSMEAAIKRLSELAYEIRMEM